MDFVASEKSFTILVAVAAFVVCCSTSGWP